MVVLLCVFETSHNTVILCLYSLMCPHVFEVSVTSCFDPWSALSGSSRKSKNPVSN